MSFSSSVPTNRTPTDPPKTLDVHGTTLRFVAAGSPPRCCSCSPSSSAVLLAQLAPGDYLSSIGGDPRSPRGAAPARARPANRRQYREWLGRAARLDPRRVVRSTDARSSRSSASTRRTRRSWPRPRSWPRRWSASPPASSREPARGLAARAIRASSVLLLSVPPLVTSLALLTVAARTGWLPGVGDRRPVAPRHPQPRARAADRRDARAPAAEAISRGADAAEHRAAAARGISRRRIVWRHALRLSLGSTLAIYGVVVGSLFSGASPSRS